MNIADDPSIIQQGLRRLQKERSHWICACSEVLGPCIDCCVPEHRQLAQNLISAAYGSHDD